MLRNTGIKDHSNPNQNKVITAISIAGFSIKKSINRTFSPTGLIQSSGRIWMEIAMEPLITTIHNNKLNKTLLSKGLYVFKI